MKEVREKNDQLDFGGFAMMAEQCGLISWRRLMPLSFKTGDYVVWKWGKESVCCEIFV